MAETFMLAQTQTLQPTNHTTKRQPKEAAMSTATATAENKKPRSSGGAEKRQRRKEVLVFLSSPLFLVLIRFAGIAQPLSTAYGRFHFLTALRDW
jgi:hypothetical protein